MRLTFTVALRMMNPIILLYKVYNAKHLVVKSSKVKRVYEDKETSYEKASDSKLAYTLLCVSICM